MPVSLNKFSRAVVLAACVVSHAPAMALDHGDQSALCEAAIVSAARETGVPQRVLHAISLTETGRRQNGSLRPWPWAVNREGQGYWFASQREALEFAKRSVGAGRYSFDTGCFQINYHWHGHNFDTLEKMFDPRVGALYAAQFLRDLYSESGDWSVAAGSYHSRTPHYARIYRARFDQMMGQLAPIVQHAVAVPDDQVQDKPVRTRTRMQRRPLIITIDPDPDSRKKAREERQARVVTVPDEPQKVAFSVSDGVVGVGR